MYRPTLGKPAGAGGEVGIGLVDVPILMYHSVATHAEPGFARFVVSPAEFAAQMDYLASEGYRPMTALALASAKTRSDIPGRPVVLTFDDAYGDFETSVMPVLQKHGFPATLYVPTAYVGGSATWLRPCGEGDRPILSWQAIRDVAAAGIEIASHSHTHPQLDRVTMPEISEEVSRSRHLLEDELNSPIEGFAYPFGYWNRKVRSSVSAAGYTYACAVAGRAASHVDDLLTLPRFTVTPAVGVEGLAQLMAATSTPAVRWTTELKRLAWAAMRRHIRSIGGDPRASE